MFKKLIFHSFKGTKIDVSSIITFSNYKRKFYIRDTDKPYQIDIICEDPHECGEITPFIGFGGMGILIQERVKWTRKHSIRYECEQELKNDIDTLVEKQNKLEKMRLNLIKILET